MNATDHIDTLEVPRLNEPPVQGDVALYYVAFAHHLLTRLFEYDSAVLHAEYRRPPSGEVTWNIGRRDDQSDGPDTVVATSNPAEFRAVLARLGFLYIGGETYGGHSTVVLSQEGRKWRCHFFMANIREMGFWIRVYAHAA